MRAEIIEKLAALITAAFGLVAALAWNDAIKSIISRIYTTPNSVGPMLLYAIVITIIAVIVTLFVGRASDRAKKLEIDVDLKENIKKFSNLRRKKGKE